MVHDVSTVSTVSTGTTVGNGIVVVGVGIVLDVTVEVDSSRGDTGNAVVVVVPITISGWDRDVIGLCHPQRCHCVCTRRLCVCACVVL